MTTFECSWKSIPTALSIVLLFLLFHQVADSQVSHHEPGLSGSPKPDFEAILSKEVNALGGKLNRVVSLSPFKDWVIDLSRTKASDKDLRELFERTRGHANSLDQIYGIDVSKTDISDLSFLPALPQVKKLNVSHTKMSNESLCALLRKCRSLRYLHMSHLPATNQTVKVLADVPLSLFRLSMAGSRINDDAAEDFGTLTFLAELDLSHTDITDKFVKSCIPSLKRLESLKLSGTEVTEKSIAVLAAHERLRVLDLSETGIRAPHLDQLVQLKQLEVLIVGNRVSEGDIRNLRKAMPKVKIVNTRE